MANDFVADPMNRVKPGDIISVRVIAIDEKRGRIGFSMKPEAAKPARTPAKTAAENSSNDDKSNRPRNSRPDADKRPPRPKRQDRADKGSSSATDNRSKAPKPKAEAPIKMGTLGALLKEAGVSKAKK